MDELNYWQDTGVLCSLISVPIYNLSKKLTRKKRSLSIWKFTVVRKCLPEPRLYFHPNELGRASSQPGSARVL